MQFSIEILPKPTLATLSLVPWHSPSLSRSSTSCQSFPRIWLLISPFRSFPPDAESILFCKCNLFSFLGRFSDPSSRQCAVKIPQTANVKKNVQSLHLTKNMLENSNNERSPSSQSFFPGFLRVWLGNESESEGGFQKWNRTSHTAESFRPSGYSRDRDQHWPTILNSLSSRRSLHFHVWTQFDVGYTKYLVLFKIYLSIFSKFIIACSTADHLGIYAACI